MSRVTNAVYTKARRKRTLRKTKGYFGNKSKLYRYAKDALARSGQYAYKHRKRKKGDFRSLWIIRINAAVHDVGMTYSRFMAGVRAANIALDRKALSELAIHDRAAFNKIVDQAKAALPAPAKAAAAKA
ncbi:MAG TPA: 50S ribosomal protein L20 [Opitutales bacterium]|jgi:large subunit ribosomal protein L20|nr:50S ribosomal protein L20 [Opitutales bacterium]